MEKLLLTATEAGEAIGVGRTRIYELLASGQIPSVKIGRSVRVPIEALKRWIQERESGGLNNSKGGAYGDTGQH